jgi:hypothetical protein
MQCYTHGTNLGFLVEQRSNYNHIILGLISEPVFMPDYKASLDK